MPPPLRMCGIIATMTNRRTAAKMSSPREHEASEYLEKHKIIELMDNLTSMLFFYRPGKTCNASLSRFVTIIVYKLWHLHCTEFEMNR